MKYPHFAQPSKEAIERFGGTIYNLIASMHLAVSRNSEGECLRVEVERLKPEDSLVPVTAPTLCRLAPSGAASFLSALPLDIMTNKEFAKDPMSIDAPNTNDYAEDDVTADEDIVTNAAEKYRKYEELARQGYFGAA